MGGMFIGAGLAIQQNIVSCRIRVVFTTGKIGEGTEGKNLVTTSSLVLVHCIMHIGMYCNLSLISSVSWYSTNQYLANFQFQI